MWRKLCQDVVGEAVTLTAEGPPANSSRAASATTGRTQSLNLSSLGTDRHPAVPAESVAASDGQDIPSP